MTTMPPPTDTTATQNTPLAPSVEKAYYRKCIALKRRLNEVESANDEAKLRRVRLDRAIMKMRLERAFLLDELRKRMDHNVDGSEGSGDEGLATPPPDRPYRDKRRRPQQGQGQGQGQGGQPSTPAPGAVNPAGSAVAAAAKPIHPRSSSHRPSDPDIDDPEAPSHISGTRTSDARTLAPAPLPHGSPYAETARADAVSRDGEHHRSRDNGGSSASKKVAAEAKGAAGERLPPSSSSSSSGASGKGGAFTAVNNRHVNGE